MWGARDPSPASLRGALVGREQGLPLPTAWEQAPACLGREGQERALQLPRLLSRHLGSAKQSQGVATSHLRPVTEQSVPPAPGRGDKRLATCRGA